MKTLINVLLVMLSTLLITQCEKEPDLPDPNEPVDIPDQRFLKALIDLGVDINGDSVITHGEARDIHKLILSIVLNPEEVLDLTGIDAFIYLDTLFCSHTSIGHLDLSNNEALLVIDCHGCSLKSLDVSGNRKLTELGLGTCNIEIRNELTELDISNCKNLEVLYVDRNSLTSLDISNQTALKELSCGENELTTLDVSNNTTLEFLYLGKMPTLTKVCVWTFPFPPPGVEFYAEGSPNISFTIDCSQN